MSDPTDAQYRADEALNAIGKPSPEGLTPDEKLIWQLDNMMIGVENYFGAENPKRRGHIYQTAIRIMDEVLPAIAAAKAAHSEPTAAQADKLVEIEERYER